MTFIENLSLIAGFVGFASAYVEGKKAGTAGIFLGLIIGLIFGLAFFLGNKDNFDSVDISSKTLRTKTAAIPAISFMAFVPDDIYQHSNFSGLDFLVHQNRCYSSLR